MPPDPKDRGRHAGPSILELCWEEMDRVVARLIDAKLSGRDPEIAYVYRAQGIAYCLAIFTNPYNPNVDAIRAEAMKRWEERQA